MRWLITGGCGFIGQALTAKLTEDPFNKVRVFDNLSVGTRSRLAEVGPFVDLDKINGDQDWNPRISLVVGDIIDAAALNSATIGCDVVVHLAANTGVGPSVDDPVADCKANVLGVLNALEACRHNGIKRFVFASSGAPLGVQEPPLHENLAPRPASPYGASKLAGEGYCSAYYHCFGVETVALRFGNVYGPGSTHKSSVVAKFIKQVLDGIPLEIYGDGNQTRDYIYILDLISAIRLAAERPAIGGNVFQIATAKETTVSDMTNLLIEIVRTAGLEAPNVVHGECRTGDVLRNYSDTSKAKDMLGWQAETSLKDGLVKTLNFFVETRRQARADTKLGG